LQFDGFPAIIASPKLTRNNIENTNIQIPGGNAVNTIQRYELIRPILKLEKTPAQVSKEADIPLSTVYYYLKRLRENSGDIESLSDRSHANHSHPRWLTQEDKDKVVQYKLQHPHLSSRQIAKAMTKEGIRQISHHSVADILGNCGLSTPFLLTGHLN